MQRLSTRASWWMTAASFAWVWGLLSVVWPARYVLCLVLALCFGVATWVASRWPVSGLVLTAAGLAGLGFLGIGTEEPAPLGPLFIVLVTVGYLVPPRWGVLAVPFLLTATALPARWDLASVVFGGILLFLPWWFGVQVRVRDSRRREAAEDVRRLAGVDPSVLARQAAATERDEVATSAFEVIGHAVRQMSASAAAARETLDPAAIEAIHRKGEEATQRLRALLVLLRDDSPPTVRATDGRGQPEPTRPAEDGLGWRQVLLNGWPALLILVDVLTMPFAMAALRGTDGAVLPEPGFLLLVVLPLMAAVVVRDRWPELALLGATLVLVLGTVTGVATVGGEGLWLMIGAMALSWTAGQSGTRRVLAAWFVFTMTLGYLVWSDTPYYLPIFLAMEALPFGAGAVWSGHHAAETASLGLARVRQAEIVAAERVAVSHERLHLARDLHDAASHAVGTMMMQANAARVLRERDPDEARSALDAVLDIGREAASDLRAISARVAGLAEADSARAGHGDGTGDIAEAIAPLVTAARRTGAQVSTALDLQAAPSPEDVVLLLRVVREGLANAVRHAPGSEVTVRVSVTGTRIMAVVANGPAHPDPRQDGLVMSPMGLGLGLRGLRELVGERRGEVSAGATGPGFELRATFPPHRAGLPAVLP